MRTCQRCGKRNVKTRTGPATCKACVKEKYLIVKRRYQKSLKGQATTKTYEQLPEVKEKRRLQSASIQGRKNKKKYESTDKGKRTRHKAIEKYKNSEHGKCKAASHHQLTKHLPKRVQQRREADLRYKKSSKGKALKMRQYAKRRHAIQDSDNKLTATDWAEILKKYKNRCAYCQQKTKLTIDHVMPLSKGGKHTKDNVVPACLPCNVRKGNRTDWLIVPVVQSAEMDISE